MTHRNWQSGRWCHLCQSMGRGHGTHGAQPAQVDGVIYANRWVEVMVRTAHNPLRVTTILLASQMARECRANVLWWTGAMSRKRHSFTSPECPTPMSIDPAMACHTVKKGTLPEVDPLIRSEERVELTTVWHPVQNVSIAATSPSLRSITRITSDAAPHSGHVPSQDSAEPLHEQGQ